MSQHVVSTPVRYNSVVYRSASEVRLAVFLTILRIPFVPQPRAYAVDGIGYLPDFELPRRLWVEVRGAYERPVDAWRKAALVVLGFGRADVLVRRRLAEQRPLHPGAQGNSVSWLCAAGD